MSSALSAHPKEQMADLLATLRSYAKRVFVQGDLLTSSEAQDKSLRMNQFLQMGAQNCVVLDHAIVDQNHFTVTAGMRVRVFVGGLAVRCPACMSDSNGPLNRIGFHQLV